MQNRHSTDDLVEETEKMDELVCEDLDNISTNNIEKESSVKIAHSIGHPPHPP